jgi:hypothetical protein
MNNFSYHIDQYFHGIFLLEDGWLIYYAIMNIFYCSDWHLTGKFKITNFMIVCTVFIFKPGSHEKDMVKWFSEKYNFERVCVTPGVFSVLIYNNGQFYEHSGFKVNVKAGLADAFPAGLHAKYLSEESQKITLEYACATGALVVAKTGATQACIQDKNYVYNQGKQSGTGA